MLVMPIVTSPESWRHHRSEEHTSELQSQSNLVCRLLLEKKKKKANIINSFDIALSLHMHTLHFFFPLQCGTICKRRCFDCSTVELDIRFSLNSHSRRIPF